MPNLQTYDIDLQVPDSAATASAIYSGIKTNSGTMGFDSSIDYTDVDSMRSARNVTNIVKYAQDAGMSMSNQ